MATLEWTDHYEDTAYFREYGSNHPTEAIAELEVVEPGGRNALIQLNRKQAKKLRKALKRALAQGL